MLYILLNFRIYVMDVDPASYRLESTVPLFRNNTSVPLFLFRVRTAQQSLTRSLSLARFWTCRWAVQKWYVFVTCSFLMHGGRLETKSSGEDRNANLAIENV